MSIIKAILLGFVQGVTEFLPTSSSGHLSVIQHFLNVSSDSSLMFDVLLHLGTLVAVFIVYWKTLLLLLAEAVDTVVDIFKRRFSFKNMSPDRHMLFMFIVSCFPLLLLLIPVGGGKNLMDVCGNLAADGDIIVEGFCFLFTAALLIFGSRATEKKKKPLNRINPKSAVAVGFAQAVAAALPGVSRSGSTISTGMLCGVSKKYMVRYSFILGIPAILAANLVELKDAIGTESNVEVLPIIAGVITAAVVGFAAIKVLEWLVKENKFKYFGYYCLCVGVFTLVAGITEKI